MLTVYLYIYIYKNNVYAMIRDRIRWNNIHIRNLNISLSFIRSINNKIDQYIKNKIC